MYLYNRLIEIDQERKIICKIEEVAKVKLTKKNVRTRQIHVEKKLINTEKKSKSAKIRTDKEIKKIYL